MDAAERSLLEQTVRDTIVGGGAPTTSTGVDEVLAGLGWREMLEAERRDSVDIVFRRARYCQCHVVRA